MIVAPAAKLDGVYGGWNTGTGSATGNTVIIGRGATIGSAGVSGGTVDGASANAKDNTVELQGATINGIVMGGRGGVNRVTGNTLILSGENTVSGYCGVQNFETIKLSDVLEWNAGQTVLNATSSDRQNFTNENSSTKMTLDISAATKLQSATPGTMTLLSAGKTDAFEGMPLKYFNDGTATLNTTGTEVFKGEATNEKNGVTLAYNATHTVKLEDSNKKKVTYNVAVDNNLVKTVTLGEIAWDTSTAARTLTTEGLTFNGTTAIDATNLKFTNPEAVTGSMTLLSGATNLATIAETEKNVSYAYSPVAGVMINGEINGSYKSDSTNIVYTATANKADKLTFTNVEWKDSGALFDHSTALANVSFNGAAVDTSNINFTNIQSLEANKKMTLVSDFGNSVGTITGTKYKVGSTLEGTGKASLVGNDLIFTAETGTSQEQTHNTVMGAEVGMAALSAGNDFVGTATDGLAMASNVGADGVSSFAKLGGGTMRQETGSHVDTHTWNAILALGHANKKERGTMEYGAFFEYGTGNYTTHNGDERGDGSTRYTGGGLLAKWTAKHGMYVEGSLRAGSVHDDARNVLRDVNGVPYSYETNAPYMGFHLGVGKIIPFDDIHSLDVYGKYFYNRRNGVSFNAGGHYDLDAVTSSVIRLGARYTVKRDRWNFYGGVAYEHELDGKANGTADGMAIRGADIGGGSFRGELGASVTPDKNVPVTLDFNVTGFAGKKQGFSGGVSVAFMF